MDCIVSHHLNSFRSGVAKFNTLLARRLGIPLYGVFDDAVLGHRRPLLSFKVHEFPAQDLARLRQWLGGVFRRCEPRVFLHAFSRTPLELEMLRGARVVYCGNALIYEQIRALAPRAVEVWTPPMIEDRQPFELTEISVFTFGMAHKIRRELYGKLHRLLEATGKSYALIVSAAFHESVTFEDSSLVLEELRGIFGRNLYHMGFLSDAAVSNLLRSSTFFAAFLEGGVRANNTTVAAAMDHGATVITNLDRFSPAAYAHMVNVIDINRCEELPLDPEVLNSLRSAARATVRSLDWDALVARISAVEAPEAPRPRAGPLQGEAQAMEPAVQVDTRG
jgi:hypothetical protein